MTAGGGVTGAWSPRVSGQPAGLDAPRLHLSLSVLRISSVGRCRGVMLGLLVFA